MSFFRPSFTSTFAPVRVRFGAGLRRELGDELALLGAKRALIVTTPRQGALGEELASYARGAVVGVFSKAAMHTPVALSDEGAALAQKLGADVVVAVGGGSTTGLSKAIARRLDLDQIILPTTYAGSEATAILGETEGGRKTTQTTPLVQPEVILYDPELSLDLPKSVSVTSGLNAMAHAAEGLYAQNRSPLSSLIALEGLRAFQSALPKLAVTAHDVAARGEALYAAWLCGTVLGQVGMALHHKLCHTLGGSFNLAHADTHAVILPHALAYNGVAAGAELSVMTPLFGADIGGGVHDFARRLGAPLALRDLGMAEADLERAVELACQNPYWNPRAITPEGLRGLLRRAWAGEPPLA